MPAQSERQRRAAGAALAAKRRGSAKGLQDASKDMYESMSEEKLVDFVSKSIDLYLGKERKGDLNDKGEG